MGRRYVANSRVRELLERFDSRPVIELSAAELELIQLAQDELMKLLPVQLSMAQRWHAPTARLLVLGPARAGLSGTELFACRGIIVEARNAMHEAIVHAGS